MILALEAMCCIHLLQHMWQSVIHSLPGQRVLPPKPKSWAELWRDSWEMAVCHLPWHFAVKCQYVPVQTLSSHSSICSSVRCMLLGRAGQQMGAGALSSHFPEAVEMCFSNEAFGCYRLYPKMMLFKLLHCGNTQNTAKHYGETWCKCYNHLPG